MDADSKRSSKAYLPRDQQNSARKQTSFEQTKKEPDSNQFSEVLDGPSASHDDALIE